MKLPAILPYKGLCTYTTQDLVRKKGNPEDYKPDCLLASSSAEHRWINLQRQKK